MDHAEGNNLSIASKEELLVGKWTLIRRNELVDIPEKLEIHPDFLQGISYEAFESAFREIGRLFIRYILIWRMTRKDSACRYIRRINMIIFPVRQGRQGVRPGSCFTSCSVCLCAEIFMEPCFWQIRRRSKK